MGVFKTFRPKLNSKTQQEKRKNPEKIYVVACKNCHISNTTLVKGPDSYYCKFCYDKLFKKK